MKETKIDLAFLMRRYLDQVFQIQEIYHYKNLYLRHHWKFKIAKLVIEIRLHFLKSQVCYSEVMISKLHLKEHKHLILAQIELYCISIIN